jgi:hypothetical protein
VAEAETLLYVDRLAVYDSTGRQIGNAWPASDDAWLGHRQRHMVVEFRFGTRPAMVRLQRKLFTPDGFAADWLTFSGPGCTGDVMIDPSFFNGSTAVAGPRSTVYVKSGPMEVRIVGSLLSDRGVCTNYDDDEPAHEVIPLRTTGIDLADHFVPPFTVQTRGATPVPRVTP